MLKIAICEDAITDFRNLEQMLVKTNLFEMSDCSYYSNGKELIQAIESGKYYDFVFLDVDMPLINGIETGKYINSVHSDCLIIFVTGYPQYAIDAFDCNAFHYILKTDNYDRFYSVVQRAMEKYKMMHRIYRIDTRDGSINLQVPTILLH